MTTPRLLEFIARLPKAELHVHQVGSAPPRVVAELAAAYPAAGVPSDPAELSDFFTFTGFPHFIEVYLSVVDLVRTPEDVRLLTYEVARDLAAEQVRYAELICTPYTSVLAGVAAEGFCEAIEDARFAAERDFGIQLRWSFDIPGEFGLPAAEETLRIATVLRPAVGWSPSGSAGQKPASGASSSRRPSTPPALRVCTPCRTPARPPGRPRSGRRCAISVRSGSVTGSPRLA